MQRISSLAERDPPLFTLFRHSSRNQRYKYARPGLLAYSKGRRRISWRDLIHSRARFRGIAGAKMISRPRRTRPLFNPFQRIARSFRLFSHQNPPCLPTASIPTLFEIFERKKSQKGKRKKKKKQLQEVDDEEEIEKRGMVERNEANEVEEPSFRGEIESEMEKEEEEEEDETRWKWWWDRDEGDKTRRGCVTGRNVPGRSRRFRDRPEALRFARIEGRRGGETVLLRRSGRAYSSGTAARRYVPRKEMSVWRTCRGCPRDTCTSVDFSWSE